MLKVHLISAILNEDHELFINKNKKSFEKLKIETPKISWIDKFICLRSKMYAFKRGDEQKVN